MSEGEGPKRRQFKAEYKQSVLDRLDACAARGDRSRVLQEEDLLWSHVAKWRRQREAGMLDDSWSELSSHGRLDMLLQEREALLDEIEGLRTENDQLRRKVGRALALPTFKERIGRLLRRPGRDEPEIEDDARGAAG